jgi:hypothetical protein
MGFQSGRSKFELISNRQFGSDRASPTLRHLRAARVTGTQEQHAHFLVAACHFKQVVAELCFDWALQCVDVGTEYDLIEFFYHHAWAKLAKISTLRLGRAA